MNDATFSECGTYRYSLNRQMETGGRICTFIMLNPSTADAVTDDPTIRRCVGFAKRLGHQGLNVVNLFAYRATKPDVLKTLTREKAIGGRNDYFIMRAISDSWWSHGDVICAWGAHGSLFGRGQEVEALLSRLACSPMCLGKTAAGEPRHPLYLPAGAALLPL